MATSPLSVRGIRLDGLPHAAERALLYPGTGVPLAVGIAWMEGTGFAEIVDTSLTLDELQGLEQWGIDIDAVIVGVTSFSLLPLTNSSGAGFSTAASLLGDDVRALFEGHLAGLLAQYGDYCIALFEDLVRVDPAELARLIRSGKLVPGRLTHAAESLGRAPDAGMIAQTLIPLLDRPSPVVREGALYGLARHLGDERIRAAVARVAAQDPSPALQVIARELLLDAE